MGGRMSDQGRDPVLKCRIPAEMKEELEQEAQRTGQTVSDVARGYLYLGRETAETTSQAVEDIEERIQTVIERNKTVKELLPSDWRDFVSRRFAEAIQKDYDPADIETLGSMLREQAAEKEEMAQQIPVAPDADLVGIVDDVLLEALEASDLTNYYEDVENRYERHFAGVEEGKQQREKLISVVEDTVRSHNQLAAAFEGDVCPEVSPTDIPQAVETWLPEGTDREDVARLATQLVNQGATAEDVSELVPTTDPTLQPVEVESQKSDRELTPKESDDQDADQDEAIIVMGGQKQNGRWADQDETGDQDEAQPDETDEEPQSVESVEAIQETFRQNIPAADGGRDDRSVRGTVDDTTMNPTTSTNDDSTELELAESTETAQEVEADE